MFTTLNKTISIRLTESDALFLQEQAAQSGMTVSQIIRSLIRAERKKGGC